MAGILTGQAGLTGNSFEGNGSGGGGALRLRSLRLRSTSFEGKELSRRFGEEYVQDRESGKNTWSMNKGRYGEGCQKNLSYDVWPPIQNHVTVSPS